MTSEGRQLVVDRGLVGEAVARLTARALGTLAFESLAPTKALLKRFFSAGEWGPADDEALAGAVGPGEGTWTEPLAPDLAMAFGWVEGRFGLSVTATAGHEPTGSRTETSSGLEGTFDGPVVPEATPNPRSIMFRTPPLHGGDSREYASAAEAAADERVAGLFAAFADLATVMVARDFVAVTLRQAWRWEVLLAPVLRAVTHAFAGGGEPRPAGDATAQPEPLPQAPAGGGGPGRDARLDRAWRALGGLRPAGETDLDRVIAATTDGDASFRQVSAGLLSEAPPAVAADRWAALAGDPSRRVRRAAVDAMAGAGRPGLRPLLERSLGDADAWVRWKALRGLADLGAGPSRAAIEAVAADPDFRVRLEATATLRRR